jgi:DNA-binding Xre family transcriptional regulator
MAPPKRTPLTAEQRAIAAKMKSIWLQKRDELSMTQTDLAARIGITQGALTQFLNQHIAIHTDFVLDFCRELRVDPADVHARYKDIVLLRKRA